MLHKVLKAKYYCCPIFMPSLQCNISNELLASTQKLWLKCKDIYLSHVKYISWLSSWYRKGQLLFRRLTKSAPAKYYSQENHSITVHGDFVHIIILFWKRRTIFSWMHLFVHWKNVFYKLNGLARKQVAVTSGLMPQINICFKHILNHVHLINRCVKGTYLIAERTHIFW